MTAKFSGWVGGYFGSHFVQSSWLIYVMLIASTSGMGEVGNGAGALW